MKTFLIPEFGITVQLDGPAGTISSELKKHMFGNEPSPCDFEINGAIDAIESLILAHACAGMDIMAPEYYAGLVVALDTVGNEYQSFLDDQDDDEDEDEKSEKE